MNLYKTLIAATMAAALSTPLVANAINIDGIEFEAGSIFETLDLFEGLAICFKDRVTPTNFIEELK